MWLGAMVISHRRSIICDRFYKICSGLRFEADAIAGFFDLVAGDVTLLIDRMAFAERLGLLGGTVVAQRPPTVDKEAAVAVSGEGWFGEEIAAGQFFDAAPGFIWPVHAQGLQANFIVVGEFASFAAGELILLVVVAGTFLSEGNPSVAWQGFA